MAPLFAIIFAFLSFFVYKFPKILAMIG